MLAWLSENLVNIVIIAILLFVVGWLIRGMIRDKKAGKSSCCGSCASCGACSGHAVKAKVLDESQRKLFRTRVEVEGMMCGMCEAHVNDAVRKAIPVKKVSSSHTKGETIIITEGRPDTQRIQEAIDGTGYSVQSIESMPYISKSLKPSFS